MHIIFPLIFGIFDAYTSKPNSHLMDTWPN